MDPALRLAVGLWSALDELRRVLPTLPGDGVAAPSVEPFLEWIERNRVLLYPLFGLGAIALLAWGVLSALRGSTDEVTGLVKVEYKRSVITALRREVEGATLEMLCKEAHLDKKRMSNLLRDMEEDNLVWKDKEGLWRMKGISGGMM